MFSCLPKGFTGLQWDVICANGQNQLCAKSVIKNVQSFFILSSYALVEVSFIFDTDETYADMLMSKNDWRGKVCG